MVVGNDRGIEIRRIFRLKMLCWELKNEELSVSIAAALLLTAGVANAGTLSINPAVATPQPGAGTGPTPTTITVNWDNTGPVTTLDSIDTDVTYDGADLSVTVAGNCSANNPGVVIVSIADGNSNPIASGPLCTMTFTTWLALQT